MATFNESELGGPQDNIVNASDLPPQPIPHVGELGLPTTMPEAPSYSVNDFAKWREQDQTVAQLASQLADMAGDPWTVHQLEALEAPAPASSQHWVGNYYDRRKSPVLNLANQLSKLSAPLATYLQDAAAVVSGAGHVPCVRAGNRIITGAGPEVSRQLNGDVIEITAPIRKRILGELHEYAQTGIFPSAASERYWVCEVSNQLVLFFATQEEAQEYADKLNASYHAAAANYQSLILKDLLEATDPSMGATLRNRVTENDQSMPDFRAAKSVRIAGA